MRFDAARVIPQPGHAEPVQRANGQNVGPSSDGVKTASRPTARKGAARNSRSRHVLVTPQAYATHSLSMLRHRMACNRDGKNDPEVAGLSSDPDSVEGAVEERGGPEEPSAPTRVVEATVVGDLAEDRSWVLT